MGLNTQFPSWLQDQNQLNAQVGMQLGRNFMEGMKMAEEKRLNEAKLAEMRRMNDVQAQQARAQIARDEAATQAQINLNNYSALTAQGEADLAGKMADFAAMQQDLYKLEGGLSNPDARIQALEFVRNNPKVAYTKQWTELTRDLDTAEKANREVQKVRTTIEAYNEAGRYQTPQQKNARDLANASGFAVGSPEYNKIYSESLSKFSQRAPTGIVATAEASIADKFGGAGQPSVGSKEWEAARAEAIKRSSRVGQRPSFEAEFNTIKDSGKDEIQAALGALDVMSQHPDTSKKFLGSEYIRGRVSEFQKNGIQFDPSELKDEIQISTHKIPDTYAKQLIRKDSDINGLQKAVSAIEKFNKDYGDNAFASYVGPIDSWQNKIKTLTQTEPGRLSEKDQLALDIMQGALIINEPGRKELYGANFTPLEQIRQELQFPSGKNPNYEAVLRNFVNVSRDQLKNELYDVKFKENVPINVIKNNLSGKPTPVNQTSPFFESSRIGPNQFRYTTSTNAPANPPILPSGWRFNN